ncbi:MAG: type II toxin-antitoxin system VapC family toxin [Rhodoferax sp.]|nr:type II toxin-antitoxin system VapC family toxin [Rhodoferax sp.]
MTAKANPSLVLDSSALILFLNDALPEHAVALLQDHLQRGQALISSIVRAEVLAWSGHTTKSLAVTMDLLDICQLIPVGKTVADEAARIRRETGLKLPDALIAATALLQPARLLTANSKDFRRVPGLVLREI